MSLILCVDCLKKIILSLAARLRAVDWFRRSVVVFSSTLRKWNSICFWLMMCICLIFISMFLIWKCLFWIFLVLMCFVLMSLGTSAISFFKLWRERRGRANICFVFVCGMSVCLFVRWMMSVYFVYIYYFFFLCCCEICVGCFLNLDFKLSRSAVAFFCSIILVVFVLVVIFMCLMCFVLCCLVLCWVVVDEIVNVWWWLWCCVCVYMVYFVVVFNVCLLMWNVLVVVVDELDVDVDVVVMMFLGVKKGCYWRDKFWDYDGIDYWSVMLFMVEDNLNGVFEESSFAVLFLKYREKYLRETWSSVMKVLKE